MNLSKELKKKRDSEDRLRQSSPQIQYIEGTGYIDLSKLAAKDHKHAFTDLTDSPADYTGMVGKVVKVKSTEDGLEFGEGGGAIQQATETELGGIKAKAKTTETSEIAIDTATGKLYGPSPDAATNGLPAGGTAGQIPIKNSENNYDVRWGNVPYSPDTPPTAPSVWDDEFSDGIIATAWEDYNLSSGTKAEASDVQVLKIGAAGSGLSQQGLVKTCPTGDFTITIKQVTHATLSASWRYGIIVTESKTGRAYVLTSLAQNSVSFKVLWEAMSSPTIRTGYAIGANMGFPYVYLKMRVYNDSGTWKVTSSWSDNGYKYNISDMSRALGFTPAYIGLVVNSEGVAGVNEGWFSWFRVVED
jgi:hypothetical protein